jgi:hypothetical protein
VAAFASWALLAVGAWATIFLWRRDGLRPAAAVAVACAAAVAALDGALAAVCGYDPIGAVQSTRSPRSGPTGSGSSGRRRRSR